MGLILGRGRLGAVWGRRKHICEASVLGGHKVSVGVEQYLGGRPASLVLNPLERSSPGHMNACPGVTQIVRCVAPLATERSLHQLLEHPRPEIRAL